MEVFEINLYIFNKVDENIFLFKRKQRTICLSTKKIRSVQCTKNESKPEQIEQDLTSERNSSLNA